MERTQSYIIDTSFFENNKFTHHVFYIGGFNDLIYCFVFYQSVVTT